MSKRRILITAGEASGDAHGAGLVRALRDRLPDASFQGIGGPEMEAAGVELLGRAEDLAVVGLFEVLGRLPRVLRLLRRVRRQIRRAHPDLFIPIDAPDFNFRLLPTARRAGVPVVYFVAPQLWAWRAGRVRTLRRYVQELLVLFPFEKEWFGSRGVPTRFIGHPRVDAARAARSAQMRTANESSQSGYGLLLPGSRRGEIRRHLPLMNAAVVRLRQFHPELRWRLRLAPEVEEDFYRRWALNAAITPTREPILDLAAGARVALAASGTASFEVALMGTPLLVVYRVHPLTWQLARRIVRVPWIAMANLAAQKRMVPELLQEDCTPERIAAELSSLIGDAQRRAQMGEEAAALRETFGPPGAFARAAERVAEILGDPAPGR